MTDPRPAPYPPDTRAKGWRFAAGKLLDATRVAPEKAVLRPALSMFLLPGWNGTDMRKMSYGVQLKHPNWQRKRLEILQRDEWRCVECEATEKTLHVHHKRYIKGRMAWDYDNADLASVCEDCHEADHEGRDLIDEILARNNRLGLITREVVAVLAGRFLASYDLDEDLERRCIAYAGEDAVMSEAGARIAVQYCSRENLADLIERAHKEFDTGEITLDPAASNVVQYLREWAQKAGGG